MQSFHRVHILALAATLALAACTTDSGESAQSASREAAGTSSPAVDQAAPTDEALTAATQEPAASLGPAGAPAPAAQAAPPVERMAQARPAGKIGVPVDVRYEVAGTVANDQPATVHLAFVPRVEGRNLQVDFPDTPGLTVQAVELATWPQKAGTSDVFRKAVLVTPAKAQDAVLKAMVSFEVGNSRFYSVYAIPLGEPAAPAKGKRPLQH